MAELGSLPPPGWMAEPPISSSAFSQLFEGRQRGRTIIMLLLAWIFQTLGFYGFVAWVPTLLVEHGFSLVQSLSYTSLIAICNPLGSLIASDLVERFERKWFIAVDGVLIAIFGRGLRPLQRADAHRLFGALVVMTIQCMAVALYTYTPELSQPPSGPPAWGSPTASAVSPTCWARSSSARSSLPPAISVSSFTSPPAGSSWFSLSACSAPRLRANRWRFSTNGLSRRPGPGGCDRHSRRTIIVTGTIGPSPAC